MQNTSCTQATERNKRVGTKQWLIILHCLVIIYVNYNPLFQRRPIGTVVSTWSCYNWSITTYNSKVTGSNPVWVELFFFGFRAYSFCKGIRMYMISSHSRYRWVANERAWRVNQRSGSPIGISFFLYLNGFLCVTCKCDRNSNVHWSQMLSWMVSKHEIDF